MKINSKCFTNLNVRAKAVKPLEENLGVSLRALEFGSGFLDMTLKAYMTKEKRDKLNFI